MLKNFLKRVGESFKELDWHPMRPYDQILLDAKQAGYKFEVYLDSGPIVFQGDNIELLSERIVFKNDKDAFSIRYTNIRHLKPLLKEKKMQIILRRRFSLMLLVIPLVLLILGMTSFQLSDLTTRNAAIDEFVAPSSSFEPIESLIFRYDSFAPYYNGPEADEIIAVVRPIVIRVGLYWFGQALLIAGLLIVVWLFVLFFYSGMANKNIIIAERSVSAARSAIESGAAGSRFEHALDTVRRMAWLVVTLVILFAFWKPLQNLASLLPDLAQRANTVQIGDLVINIGKNLSFRHVEPSENVQAALSQLTPDDISGLLGLTGSACYAQQGILPTKARYAELLNLGLFQEVTDKTFSSPDCVYGIEVTSLGRDTQNYLYALIAEFVRQLNQPSSVVTATPAP